MRRTVTRWTIAFCGRMDFWRNFHRNISIENSTLMNLQAEKRPKEPHRFSVSMYFATVKWLAFLNFEHLSILFVTWPLLRPCDFNGFRKIFGESVEMSATVDLTYGILAKLRINTFKPIATINCSSKLNTTVVNFKKCNQ